MELLLGITFLLFSRIYKALVDHPQPDPAFKWIWKCPCQPKHKVFFWLILKDRLSTRNLLRRRHMFLEDYNCIVCNLAVEETLHHLFLDCTFARQCWNLLGINMHQNSAFPDIVASLKTSLQSKFFMVAAILLCWSIWTTRNDFIFKRIRSDVQDCKRLFIRELKLVAHRVKQAEATDFEAWMHSIFPP